MICHFHKIVSLLQHADNIILLEDGHIARQGSYRDFQSSMSVLRDIEDSQGHETPSDNSSGSGESPKEGSSKWKKAKDPAAREIEELTGTNSRDTSLYGYYFNSIGWKLGVVALSTGIARAFFAQFSRKYQALQLRY